MTSERPFETLKVFTDGGVGPYFRTTLDQLAEVRRHLDRERVHYWVEHTAISVDDGPYLTVVNLGRQGDAAQVQPILDQILPTAEA